MRRLLLLAAFALAGCSGAKEAPSAPDTNGLTGEADSSRAVAAPPVARTAAMGEQIFKRCAACHTITKDGPNGIGPNLHGIVGRARASYPGFAYSDALRAAGGHWDEAALDAWLDNPMKAIPGSRMSFAGIPDKADRNALFLYLKSQSD